MVRTRTFATALLVGTASASLIVGGMTATAAAQAATGNYQVESQPLAQALMQLSRQANVDIVASSKVTRGKTAKAASGASVEVALRQMLAGTGLTFRQAGNRYVVQEGNVSGPATGSASPAPARQPAAQIRGARTGSNIVEGRVSDETTGAALKGALVEVAETGETARTDGLGEYRLVRVPAGNVTIRISYLGYAEISNGVTVVQGERALADYTMRTGSGEDIVVYGSLSARAQALNQERTAENSTTVVSSDQLGDFGGQTIAETLRRAPGVTFDRDLLTNQGTNISVRGLGPDLNAVKLNGIELPVGNGFGRSASLGNIQTESIEKVTISKTLMPNQDSAGSGGLVEIETKSPLDRDRRYASFTVEGGKRGKGFNDEFSASGTVSMRFGASNNFGLSASVQYQDVSTKRIGISNDYQFGDYLPLRSDGQPLASIDEVDPRLRFPFEGGGGNLYAVGFFANSDLTKVKNLSVTLSAAWEPADNTRLRLDYQKSRRTEENFQRTATIFAPAGYQLLPVNALDGEERYALGWTGQFTGSATYGYSPRTKADTDVLTFRGESDFGRLETKYSLGYTLGTETATSYYLNTAFDFQEFDPVYYRSDLVTDPVEGRILSLIPNVPGSPLHFPALSDAGYALINDPGNYLVNSAGRNRAAGRNSRIAGDFSAKYNFAGGPLRYLEIGGQYKRSRFSSKTLDTLSYYAFASPPPGLADFGIGFDDGLLRPIGYAQNFSALSYANLRRLVTETLPATAVDINDPTAFDPGTLVAFEFPTDPVLLEQGNREAEFAGFAQGRFDIGKLEIIGGVRLSRIRINARIYSAPNIYLDDEFGSADEAFSLANAKITDQSATQTTILPRVLTNYRVSENFIIRAGYFMSIARPQVGLLAQTSTASLFLRKLYGPNRNQPQLFLRQGNPDLKPARTHSFDIGAEYYDKSIGVAKINFFYKRIDNLLESNQITQTRSLDGIDLPDDPRFQDVIDNPDNYFITITKPVNNPDTAKIWGIETSLERQLDFLPGALNGLGIFANYTYASSSKTQSVLWRNKPVVGPDGTITGTEFATIEFPGVRFSGQSAHSGTAGLSYNKYGIDARVNYTVQGSQNVFRERTPSRLGTYGTLDARIEYRFPSGILENGRFYIEGYDLLRGPADEALKSSFRATGDIIASQYYGGRQIRLGFSKNF